MSPDEFTALMAKYGTDYNKRTLFNHTAAGCLPEPERGAGYGGKWAEYREVDVVWALTAYRLIHGILAAGNIKTASFSGIGGIKPPRIPPKTVGMIHQEVMKCLLEYKETKNFVDIEDIERFLCEQCFKTQGGSAGLLLRNLAAWYVYTLDGVILDMADINVKEKADTGQETNHMALFLAEYPNLWNNFVESVSQPKKQKA